MKKYKGLPKHLVTPEVEGKETDVKIELPDHEPLDEEISLDETSLSDENLEGTITVEASPTQPAEVDEDIKPKLPFWKAIKKENEVEVQPQKSQNLGVTKKEEDRFMSYGSNRPSGAMEPAAVISSTMVIKGDVELDTSLSVSGKVYGNIACKDQVDANEGSYFEGNINASSAKFTGGEVKGNVTCKNQFEMDQHSAMTGDLVAQSAVISGSVVGQIKCNDSVTLTRTASVKGDLYSASISVEAGARLEGKYVVSSNSTEASPKKVPVVSADE
jgi:cytoskeletal protein CcmA (bactofilin family)